MAQLPHLHDLEFKRSGLYVYLFVCARYMSAPHCHQEDARGIFAQCAEALRHSHAMGVIHRDIKPGNVLLAAPFGPGGQECVKLVDFGLSKDAPAPALPSDVPQSRTASPSRLGLSFLGGPGAGFTERLGWTREVGQARCVVSCL